MQSGGIRSRFLDHYQNWFTINDKCAKTITYQNQQKMQNSKNNFWI